MVGMFLKDREVQYTANRDEVTNTWRILNTWHEDLVSLGPDDEVPDNSSAVLILTEGAFIALVKEAARLGVLQNASFGGDPQEAQDLTEENMRLQGKINSLEDQLFNTAPTVPHSDRSEGFVLKEMAMQTLLKLTSMSDIEKLTKD
tara:strand:+ start:389 stop:826 length:438 start_codon:yes stop_codon:yes gene_type:complete